MGSGLLSSQMKKGKATKVDEIVKPKDEDRSSDIYSYQFDTAKTPNLLNPEMRRRSYVL